MYRLHYKEKLLTLIIASSLFSGCASISGDDTNRVSRVESDPSGAKCLIINAINIKRDITTPTDIFLQPKYDPINISCEKEGFKRSSDIIDTTLVDAVYGNILLGGLIGVAIDHSSGQNRKYPSLIKVFLEPKSFASNEEKRTFEDKKNAWRIAMLDDPEHPGNQLQTTTLPKKANHIAKNNTGLSTKKIAIAAWGQLDETRFSVKGPRYSNRIANLMQNYLRDTTSGSIEILNWRDAKDINFESDNYPVSRSLCSRTNADIIYTTVLEVTTEGGTSGHYPDSTYFRYSCKGNKMSFKSYTLDLDRQDGKFFLYEKRLQETFQDFLIGNGVI